MQGGDMRLDRAAIISRISRQSAWVGDLEPGELTPAAVLIALIERQSGFNVLLTRRTEHLRDHAGQISFPGGRMEAHDDSVEAAALREAEEEVGLPPAQVDVVGRLPVYPLRTGFLVHPVVGFVQPPLRLLPDPHEVAEIFEVPLSFFLDPGNHQEHSVEYQGQTFELHAMPYRGYFIWGATAAILHQFYQLLSAR